MMHTVAPTEIHLRYSRWSSLARDFRAQLSHGGMLLRLQTPLAQFSRILLHLAIPSGAAFEIEAEVVQVIPSQGVAVQFSGPRVRDILAAVEAEARTAPFDGEPDPADPRLGLGPAGDSAASPPPPPASPPATAEDPTEKAGLPLIQQIESMSVDEKRRAALHGRRDVRLLLIRDTNKTIHPFVIKNPAITLDEIEQIAKMPGVNPDALRMIGSNLEWTRSATVCRNLVHNPKTPIPLAIQLLSRLPPGDLRALAKSSHVRTAIQQAARKMIGL